MTLYVTFFLIWRILNDTQATSELFALPVIAVCCFLSFRSFSTSASSGTMFYGSTSASMSLPSKNRLKRQSRTFTQVLYRTLSYRDRRSVTDLPEQVRDDPAELSTQSSAPGVLKIFGDEISAGANYKSVLATPRSSAQELIKEALDRYSLNKASACSYVLCDVIGRFEGPERRWRTECLRALGNNEKPLLLQDLWKPKEGYARRFELRRRAEVEELAAKEKDTITAGNARTHLLKTEWSCFVVQGRSGRLIPTRRCHEQVPEINTWLGLSSYGWLPAVELRAQFHYFIAE